MFTIYEYFFYLYYLVTDSTHLEASWALQTLNNLRMIRLNFILN